MEHATGKASILLSIFKRKGGEGVLTKIITDENKADYLQQLMLLDQNGNRYLVSVEKGEPYNGIYQMLHYITSNKSATH